MLPVTRWSPGGHPNLPRSFCHSCDGLEVTYKSTVDPRGASRMVDSFHYNSNTPLVGAVAAGSAFLGELVVLPFFDAQYFKSLEEMGGLVAPTVAVQGVIWVMENHTWPNMMLL